MSGIRGYKAIQEELAQIAPLIDFLKKTRPDITFIRVTKNQFDLFERWPKAGREQSPPIEYREGVMFYRGLLIGHDKSLGRYSKPVAPEQADLVSFAESCAL